MAVRSGSPQPSSMHPSDALTLRAQRILADSRWHSPQALAWARQRVELFPLSRSAQLVLAIEVTREAEMRSDLMRGFTDRELSLGAQRVWRTPS